MDFVDEVGKLVHDFTPAVADIEVEVIFFTSSACKKGVNDMGREEVAYIQDALSVASEHGECHFYR